MIRHFYILSMVFSIMMTVSCASKYRPDLKGKNRSAERIKLVKNFATDYFAKCEKQDYSEFQGYKVDVNFKNKLTPESLQRSCEYYNSRYGTITIGELSEAKSNYSPKDFLDYFLFKAKASKSDSVQSVRVNIYRDNNMLERISIPRYRANKSKR